MSKQDEKPADKKPSETPGDKGFDFANFEVDRENFDHDAAATTKEEEEVKPATKKSAKKAAKKKATKKKATAPDPEEELEDIIPKAEDLEEEEDEESIDPGDKEDEGEEEAEDEDDELEEDDEPDEDDPDPELTKRANKAVREKLKEQTARAKAAEAEQARIIKESEDLKTQAKKASEELESLRARLAAKNPTEHPEFQKISNAFDEQVLGLAETLDFSFDEDDLEEGDLTPGANLKNNIQALIGSYRALEGMKPEEAKTQRAEIRKFIKDKFGQDSKSVMDMVVEGAKVTKQLNQKVEEIQKGNLSFESQEAQARRSEAAKEFDEATKGSFEVTDEMIDQDPYNAKVIIHDIIKADSETEGGGKFSEGRDRIKRFVRFAMMPPPTPSDDDLTGLDDEARKERVEKMAEDHKKARTRVLGLVEEAIFSHGFLVPSMKMQLDKLQSKEAARRKVKPKPGESKQGKGGGDEEEEKPLGSKEYTPPKKAFAY